MIYLRHVPGFIQCAQAGSFSKAAREMGITPQAVSHQIAALEKALGVRLFHRSTRHIALTEEGAEFLERCRRGIDTMDEFRRRLADHGKEAEGPIRLAAPHGICESFIVHLLPRFLDLYPKISVDLIVQNDAPSVVQQGLDLGIIGGKLPNSSLIARKISTFQFLLGAAPKYLRRFGRPRTMEDLKDHRCINLRHPRTGKIWPWVFQCESELVTLDIPGAVTVNDSEVQRQAVLSGAGIGQLASFFMAAHLRKKQLEPLLLGYVPPSIDLHLYMPSRTLIPKRTRVLADYLLREMRSHPDLQPLAV